MGHRLKAQELQQDRAIRAGRNARDTAVLLLSGLDTQTLSDLLALQQSAWRRYAALQQGWLTAWIGWFNDIDKIKAANTMSKLAEMESNLLARATQLLGTQITSLVALQENLEVDYSFLIKQILAGRKCMAAGTPAQYPGGG